MPERTIADEIEMEKQETVMSEEMNLVHYENKPSFSFVEFIKTPTGEGSLDEYIDHSLNFNNSKAVARILRGLTGFAGNLNLAIADIIIGTLEFTSKNKKGVAQQHDGGVSDVS